MHGSQGASLPVHDEWPLSEETPLLARFYMLDSLYTYAGIEKSEAALPPPASEEKYPYSADEIAIAFIAADKKVQQYLRPYLTFVHLRVGKLFHPYLIAEVMNNPGEWKKLQSALTLLLRKRAHWMADKDVRWAWWSQSLSPVSADGRTNPVYFTALRQIKPDIALENMLQEWAEKETDIRNLLFEIISIHPRKSDLPFFRLAAPLLKGKRKKMAALILRFLEGDPPDIDETIDIIKAESNPTEVINLFLILCFQSGDSSRGNQLLSHLYSTGAEIYQLDTLSEYLYSVQNKGNLYLYNEPLESPCKPGVRHLIYNLLVHRSFLFSSAIAEELIEYLVSREKDKNTREKVILNLACSIPLSQLTALAQLVEYESDYARLGKKLFKLPLEQALIYIRTFRQLTEGVFLNDE